MSGAPSEELGPPGPSFGTAKPSAIPAGEAASGRRKTRITLPARIVAYAQYVVPVATALFLVGIFVQTYRYERDITTVALDWRSIALVASFAFLLASVIAAVSRRLFASIAVTCGLLLLLTLLSVVKYKYVRSSLYALDFYNYASLDDLIALCTLFPRQVVIGLATVVASAAAAWFLIVFDVTRVTRRRALRAAAIGVLCLAGATYWRGQPGKMYHYFGGHYVSSAIASVPDAVAHGGFLEAADRGGKIDSTPVARFQNASVGEPAPTIISILHESSFPTEIFPVQCGGRVPSDLFTSSNGNRYDLHVETYNGATWMTEYGVLLGLSTYYLGDNRIWLGHAMENKVRDSLPQQLHRNGYDTVAVYPSGRTFVNTGPFYSSIGFDKIVDLYDMKAPSEFERDRYYYQQVIDQIRAHKASGSRAPLFVFAWTNATHALYDYVSHPGVAPDPDTICAKDANWTEYIRRLLMAEDDLAWLQRKLKSEFPDEPFMIVGFGDHHPLITEEFLEPNPSDPFTPVRGSIGYKTFFRINGVNFEPDWSVVPKSVDTPFLGNVMMQAARLPRFGFYNDRDKLMELCRGRYADCPYQDEILSFHDRMIKASTIINH